MKASIFISLVICLSSLLRAETLTTTSIPAPVVSAEEVLKAGRLQLGGGFGWSQIRDSSFHYISPSVQYFVTDSLSLGATLSYSSSDDGFSSTRLGPALNYYFYSKNQMAFYLGQEISLSKYSGMESNDLSQSGVTSLGTRIFLNENVAFGISLNRSYSLVNDEDFSDSTSLGGNFSIFY